ncbi:hypothetical protein [Caloramator sp. Dgby_cultured_2]|uniref:hypothetical protein n=1 Tax=Caloramator sp. Dgby_cultured_2 TaxID=3029174 RepID=UPI00237E0309|nr:hypothetical protein [Caloramator sp. Dgby_cultured_2]WDU82377.1 hypothetical protein PWK10_12020 [Caloramator sp. Dgby_cultured_2]
MIKTHGDFFYREGEYFCLNEELEAFINNKYFIKHFKDAVDFRIKQYYKERIKDE